MWGRAGLPVISPGCQSSPVCPQSTTATRAARLLSFAQCLQWSVTQRKLADEGTRGTHSGHVHLLSCLLLLYSLSPFWSDYGLP